jgi:hypothetical protein
MAGDSSTRRLPSVVRPEKEFVTLSALVRHNAPTGDPLSPGNGRSAPAYGPLSEPELPPSLARVSRLTCGFTLWHAESGTYCSGTLRDARKPGYLLRFSGSARRATASVHAPATWTLVFARRALKAAVNVSSPRNAVSMPETKMLDAFLAQVHRAVTRIHTSAVTLPRMARRSQQPGAVKT